MAPINVLTRAVYGMERGRELLSDLRKSFLALPQEDQDGTRESYRAMRNAVLDIIQENRVTFNEFDMETMTPWQDES